MMLTLARTLSIESKPSVVLQSCATSTKRGVGRQRLTPVWSWNDDTVSVIAYGVDYIFDSVICSSCEDDLLGRDSMDGVEVGIEEGCQRVAKFDVSANWAR